MTIYSAVGTELSAYFHIFIFTILELPFKQKYLWLAQQYFTKVSSFENITEDDERVGG
jgi:hypothetical protein